MKFIQLLDAATSHPNEILKTIRIESSSTSYESEAACANDLLKWLRDKGYYFAADKMVLSLDGRNESAKKKK